LPHPILCLLIALTLPMAALATAPGSLALPAESPLYEDLDHFRALGFWSGGLELRPISRRDFARALATIEESVAGCELGRGDYIRLERLREAAEHWNLNAPRKRRDRRSDYPPSRWEPGFSLQFFGGPTNLDRSADLDRRPRRDGALALSLDASLGRGLAAQWRWYEDYSALTPARLNNWVDNFPPDARKTFTDASSRNDRAVLAWSRAGFDLRLGREDRRFGQGRRGTLFFSENSFPLDGLSFRFQSRWVSGASLLAQSWRAPNPPLGDEDPSAEYFLGDGYFAAHRFEFHPQDSWSLGVFEGVAWGGRGIDLAYANPLGFFVAMTQDIWDRSSTDDKKILGVDFRVRRAPVTFYGELLVNRVVTLDAAAEGDSAGITSLAQLLGLRWANPFGLSGADLDIEFAHIEPEVYFHPDGDSRRSLLSEGELLGHWAGPNTDHLFAAFRFPETPAGVFHLEFEQVRWGLVDGLTGAEFGFIGVTKSEKKWIIGEIATERIFALRWEKRDWRPALGGRLDTILALARVDRGGVWEGGGWQAEMRVNWRWERVFRDES
jgi:hypothetical protein